MRNSASWKLHRLDAREYENTAIAVSFAAAIRTPCGFRSSFNVSLYRSSPRTASSRMSFASRSVSGTVSGLTVVAIGTNAGRVTARTGLSRATVWRRREALFL